MTSSKQSIVNNALDLPHQQRNAYIEDACAGNLKLKHDVLVLITQSDTATPENISQSALSTIGETIGPYKIESLIGAGGMGMIHKAKDTRLDRYIALKCLPPHLTVDNKNRERFLNEARAVSRLDHPNICTLYDIGETENKELYIAMPFYDGYTLDKQIENGPIPYKDVIAITLQICEGLHAAHSNQIVHRDIKPANIIITDNIVKILDFGVAKISGVNLTSTGVSLGTVAYMSSEQLEGKVIDARTDIWAVGVLLYEMLMGERPFKGDQAPAIIHAVLYADLPGFNLPNPIPESVTQTLRKILTRNPDNRYSSIEALMDDLRKISNNETISSHVISENHSSTNAVQTTVQFDEQTIEDLTTELTQHVGPIATVLLTKAINKSENYTELCQQLDHYLPDNETRKKMHHRFDILTSTETDNNLNAVQKADFFSDTELECVIDVTTSFIGPIAKLLVQRYSKKSDSTEDLYKKLSTHIENTADKNNFNKKVRNRF